MARVKIADKSAKVDDLEIINPNKTIIMSEQEITVREYTFLESMELYPLAFALVDEVRALFAGGIPTYQEAKSIIFNHIDPVSLLISCSIKRNDILTAKTDLEEMDYLLGVWWQVNSPVLFMLYDDMGKVSHSKKEGRGWGGIYAYLITKGCSIDQINKMTLRQILLFTTELQILDRHTMAKDISNICLGTNGGKEMTKVIKELTKE